ncbi:hypothetical protein AGIG_G7071 [Arapaima gigas]
MLIHHDPRRALTRSYPGTPVAAGAGERASKESGSPRSICTDAGFTHLSGGAVQGNPRGRCLLEGKRTEGKAVSRAVS